jgi:hypothetical protein
MFNRIGSRIGIDGMVKGSILLSGPELKEQLLYHAERLVSGNWGK